jgi:hypothetical protein
VVAGAAAIAFLRTVLVPVGSFREGLASLAWGMPADSVVAILGEPNRICLGADVDHVPLGAPDSAAVRRALRGTTTERWVYTRREGRRPIPRDAGPGCRAPSIATELGFDSRGRLAWYVREMDQTRLEIDPAVVGGPTSRR